MLAKKYRLSSRECLLLKSSGKRKNTKSALIISDDIGSPAKFGVAVPKSVAKTAVTRNRIRRRLYERIRLHPAINEAKKSVLIVLHQPIEDGVEFDKIVDDIFKV